MENRVEPCNPIRLHGRLRIGSAHRFELGAASILHERARSTRELDKETTRESDRAGD